MSAPDHSPTKKRFFVVMLIFPALLLPTYLYVSFRLASGWCAWTFLGLPFLSVLCFPLMITIRGRKKNPFEFIVSQLAYFNMGFVSFLFVVTVLRDLISLAFGWKADPWLVVGAAFLVFLIGVARGIWGPSVRRVKLPYKDLPEDLDGFRIVQISDLHISQSIGVKYINRVVKKTEALKPDLVALTGDIGDARTQDLPAELKALGRLCENGRLVFYVHGNHEVYWQLGDWVRELRALGMRVLLDTAEKISLVGGRTLFVAGITDPAAGEPNLDQASEKIDKKVFSLLLSHRPHFAEDAAAIGFDLQLSGHTHGGQFFPWTLVAGMVHRYSLGRYHLGKMWLYVNAGTGSWGPMIRLGTTSELTLIELVRE